MNKDELKEQMYATGDKKDFVHLHLHSDFSLKDGIGKPTQYAKKAIDIGMTSLAITDHGSIGAHPSFFMFCRSSNLKPIVGVEAYMQNRRLDVKKIEQELGVLDLDIKRLKQGSRHKKANKQFIRNNLEFVRGLLDMPNAELEDILALDHGEVKETFSNRLTTLQSQRDIIAKDRESLKYNEHIVLLAKNEKGRKHITKIVSNAAREGFYYRPRTSFEYLCENKEGIIVTSACLAGPLHTILRKTEDKDEAKQKALESAKMYKEAFGEDFYIEIMPIDIEMQKTGNKILIEIAKELDIKCIVTNDVHYLDPDGVKAQEVSLMLGSKDDGQQVTMRDKKRMHAIKEILNAIGDDISQRHVRSVYNDFIELDRFDDFRPTLAKSKVAITFEEIYLIVTGEKKFKTVWEFSTKDFWFKDRHDLIDTFFTQEHYKYIEVDDFITALDNTLEVANKIDLWDWDTKEKLPQILIEGYDSTYDYMVEMVRDGWTRKAEDSWYEAGNIYSKRVKYELSVIRRLELSDYFVIVADYIKYAKNNNIVVGGGRGSAAGSLVCYLLDITNIDPIKHDLLFERFLSMSRSMAIYDLSIPEDAKTSDVDALTIDDDDFEEWFDNRLLKLDE